MKDWKEYLGNAKECECGRQHVCPIEDIVIKEDAISEVPALLASENYRNIYVVSDKNTESAAGHYLKSVLKGAGISYSEIVLEADNLHADEYGIGSVLVGLPAKCDLILAVGSGTINDLCRFVSFKMEIDYFIIATAPAMDGYASNVSAMITSHLKTTYETKCPTKIIGDINVLSKAPLSMITAGAGDILGKYVCLADWKLSHLITGEYHCAHVDAMVRESIETVVDYADGIRGRDKKAVTAIMEALVLSGIAMSYIGNSRPASGSEHHLSHYWEMMFLQQGEHGAFHGTKVAVGTVIGLRMYEMLPELLKETDSRVEKGRDFDEELWKSHIIGKYGVCAAGVIALEEQVHKNSTLEVKKRLPLIKANRTEIEKLALTLPSAAEIMELLKSMEAPYLPKHIGADREMVRDSILYAKELRNRYGILQLYFDVQKLESTAEKISKELADM